MSQHVALDQLEEKYGTTKLSGGQWSWVKAQVKQVISALEFPIGMNLFNIFQRICLAKTLKLVRFIPWLRPHLRKELDIAGVDHRHQLPKHKLATSFFRDI